MVLNLKTDTPQPNDKRTKTIQELYQSEEIYISNLRDMVEGYINMLKQNEIIPVSTISEIFSNLETILKFHVGYFQKELENEIIEWNDQTSQVGQVFSALAPCFKLYTQYCSNYDRAIAAVQQARKENSQFAKFLQDTQASDRFKGAYITSLLILPIQRIPRYEMFLKELVHRTPNTHPDFAALTNALDIVAKKAEEVNEACINAENIQKITEISLSIGAENLLTPTRKFLYKCEFDLRHDSHSGLATYYLFNDLIVINSKKGKKGPIYNPIGLCWIENCTEKTFNLITNTSCYTFLFSDAAQQKNSHEKISNALAAYLELNEKDKKNREKYQLVAENGHLVAKSSEGVEDVTDKKSKKKSFIELWKREVRKPRRKKRSQTEERIIQHLSKLPLNEEESKLPNNIIGQKNNRKSVPHSVEDDIIVPTLTLPPPQTLCRPLLKKSQSYFRIAPGTVARPAPSSVRRTCK